jgi:hypothetical protein
MDSAAAGRRVSIPHGHGMSGQTGRQRDTMRVSRPVM